MRLGKRVAQAGVASRRKAEELIRARKVRVNGETVTDPARDVSESNAIEVSGKPVVADDPETYMLHKPVGVISTASDERGRQTVVDLVPGGIRLYPVGRLDADSSGLILLTNDGELANRLTHPRYEVPKTYRVTVTGAPDESAVVTLRAGVKLENGTTAPAEVKVGRLGKTSTLELTIREGRNPVTKLERVAFGPLRLGRLKPSGYRKLSNAEIAALRDQSKN